MGAATSLVLLGAKAKFLRRKPSWKRFLRHADPNLCYPTEHFPKFDCAVNSQREFVCDADAESQ